MLPSHIGGGSGGGAAEADLGALKDMYRAALCERDHRGPTGLLRHLATLNSHRAGGSVCAPG